MKLRREATMSHQLPLFQRREPTWVDRVWQSVASTEQRREAVTILIDMVKSGWVTKAAPTRKEVDREPR